VGVWEVPRPNSEVYLNDNYLDLTPGSANMQDIQELIDRGVTVHYQPQYESGNR